MIATIIPMSFSANLFQYMCLTLVQCVQAMPLPEKWRPVWWPVLSWVA